MTPSPSSAPLLLASTSRYRAQLLQRLQIAFEIIDPAVDESRIAGDDPATLAQLLSAAKAQAVAQQRPDAWVLGSDQVAACAGQILHKPGDADRQAAQLQALSGNMAFFHTAVTLVGRSRGFRQTRLSTTSIRFRTLDDAAIRRYVTNEPAFDCCGGFRCEGLGVTLFDSIAADDPTALEGLPLIATSALLRAAGFQLP